MTIIAKAVACIAISLSMILTAVFSNADSQTPFEEARRHFNRGMAAVEIANNPADYDLAIEEFQKAQALDPDWPDVYYNLGLIQEKAGKFREAVISLRKYLQLAPESPEAAAVRTLIDKTELRAEQVISDEDALDIFASLTDTNRWQTRGVTFEDAFDKIRWIESIRKDGSDLLIPFSSRCSYGSKNERVKPNGKFLEFRTMYCMCLRSIQEDECPLVTRYNLEILSKRRVKMNVRTFFPKIRGNNEGYVSDHAYEFVRR